MRLAIGLSIVVGLLVVFLMRRKHEPVHPMNSSRPSKLYSINDGNQDELIVAAEVDRAWLDSVQSKYDWNAFDRYDNRMWEYMYKLFDEAVENSGVEDYDELWNKLTREQKIFWAFLAFNGDTDNGGVYQFIFNRPEFIVAVAETWDVLEIAELKNDYENVLKEVSGKSGEIGELQSAFNDTSNSWNERWNSFAEGYQELTSTKTIEEYYYNEEFKKKIYKRVAGLIENNIEKFAIIR